MDTVSLSKKVVLAGVILTVLSGVAFAAPTVTLDAPADDSSFAYGDNITFTFTPTQVTDPISHCELYGDWGGGWGVKKTFYPEEHLVADDPSDGAGFITWSGGTWTVFSQTMWIGGSCWRSTSGQYDGDFNIDVGTTYYIWVCGFTEGPSRFFDVTIDSTVGNFNKESGGTYRDWQKILTMSLSPEPHTIELSKTTSGTSSCFDGIVITTDADFDPLSDTDYTTADSGGEIGGLGFTGDMSGIPRNFIITNFVEIGNFNWNVKCIDTALDSAFAPSNYSFAVLDLQLWLKADAGVTDTGGLVDEWSDSSGNGRDATGTGATRPSHGPLGNKQQSSNCF